MSRGRPKKKRQYPRLAKRYTLLVGLVLFVFINLFCALLLGSIIVLSITHIFAWSPDQAEQRFPLVLFAMVFGSIATGTILSAILGKHPLKPIRDLIIATQQIATGNFNVRVSLRGPLELKQLGDNFNHMAKELSSIETLRNDFVSNVSHEFKTPIVSIKGFAQVMQAEELTREEQLEYLDIIVKESTRLSQMAENVLMLSRLEKLEGLDESYLAPYSLDEQLRQTVLLLEPQWSKKDLQLQIELGPVNITGIEELLQQVWLNLLQNAIKFTPAGGVITVASKTEPGSIHIIISDTGIGMDAQTQKHLFDKFYQADKSHSAEGNGLGLSLVKRILDLTGGRLYISSEPDKGSTFEVVFQNIT